MTRYQGVVVVDIIDRDIDEESPTKEDSEILTRDIKKKGESVLEYTVSWKSRHNKHVHIIHPHLRGLGSRRPIQHHFLPAVRLGNDQRSIYISIERRKYRGGI